MARREIVEGTWSCTSCGEGGLPGRHKICPRCGNPREDREASFRFDPEAAPVVASEQLDLASAGADWFCARCSSSNRGDAQVCGQCGAERGAEPLARPAPAARPQRSGARWVPLVGAVAAPLALAVACAGIVGWLAWSRRPVDVDAAVTSRTWVREVRVQRLVPAPAESWEEQVPPPAGLPGSGALAEGRGARLSCETRKCWPRPPEGATLARVGARSWTLAIDTRRLVSRSESGWDEDVPPERGLRPVGGAGGAEGRVGSASCSTRQREPERCHTETEQVACGSHEVCTTRDLKNGFGERVCDDVTDYCARPKQVCTPAVSDRWCTWTELSWASGRHVERSGTADAPSWPAISLGSDEVETRTERYAVALTPLAGPSIREFHPPTADDLVRWEPGALVFARADGAEPVPAALIPKDSDRVDCGDGVARGVLATRRWCRYDRWSWRDEAPLRVRATGSAPGWPDGALGADGRETRTEWVELELGWARGDAHGAKIVRVDAADWDAWPIGRTVPVKVDASAGFLAWPTAPPFRDR